jgi:Tol biopolymer transport system component
MYTMKIDGTDVRRISKGGRTTCGYFYPDNAHVLYASTHLRSMECPPAPGYERGYVWPVYPGYDIFKANVDGTGLQRLTSGDGYDAEATIGPSGRIVFTSVRDGDMEIYSMNGDGSDVRRLTNRPGPDGGPFFSRDGKQIVFRGRPTQGPELTDYLGLLKDGLWRPTQLEIYVMNSDGSNVRQVTRNGHASFAPYFTPDGKRIIFASNQHDPKGRDFDLYLINVDGTGQERITWNPTFDSFPMFSPDGKRLVFASNRNAAKEGDTNVFVADWVERP